MKILWITNIMLPPLCEKLGLKVPVVGGWMYSSAKNLVEDSDITLAVATVYEGNEIVDIQIGKIHYFLLPLKHKDRTKYHSFLESYWRDIKESFKPEIVHIHGTEFAHGMAYIKACGSEGVVVSIQGLVSVYERFYYASISFFDILKSLSFRDILRFDTLFQQKRKFFERGKIEREYITCVKHVIGRTFWDKAHVWAINPKASYHHCNETLRLEFYQHKWVYEECEKYSIFTSQAAYPIKGGHKLLEAFSIVLKHYPEAKLYIGGTNIFNVPWYKKTGYSRYLSKLIKKFGIEGKVIFTGPLNSSEMCQRFLKSNIFICPSAIENSPNSLGEAQLLGVPYLVSYVGGCPDLVNNVLEDCYSFDEVEILAYKICNLFERKNVCYNTTPIEIRHNELNNKKQLLRIYEEILN